MRWQRALFSAWLRWVDIASSETPQLAPVVIPTVQLGRDYPDNERSTFYWSDFGAGAAGDVLVMNVVPAVGDVEIIAAWVTRPGGNLDAGVEFDAAPAAAAPTLVTQRSAGGICNAAVFVTSEVPPWTRGTAFTAGANETLFLPLAGTIVQLGRRLRFGSNNPGVVVAVGVLLRNVGGP